MRTRTKYAELSAEAQVQYIIRNWDDEIETPGYENEDFDMTIDDLEYRDYYFIPSILKTIHGTKGERYKDEIIKGYSTLLILC